MTIEVMEIMTIARTNEDNHYCYDNGYDYDYGDVGGEDANLAVVIIMSELNYVIMSPSLKYGCGCK